MMIIMELQQHYGKHTTGTINDGNYGSKDTVGNQLAVQKDPSKSVD